MVDLITLKNKIIGGEKISRTEATELIIAPLEELCKCADEIRKHFCKSFSRLYVYDGAVCHRR